MKGKTRIYYDEEADYLDIFIGNSRPNYGEEIGGGVTLFKDNKTNQIVGIGILEFKKRTKDCKSLQLSLPVDINFLEAQNVFS